MIPNNRLSYRECTNPECLFRFPAPAEKLTMHYCPKCGWELETIHLLKQVQDISASHYLDKGPIVEALLDNIRSSFNVGSIFRSADGAGLTRLHLCGITPTPENPAIAKTSLGAENSVPWLSHRNAVVAVKAQKKRGLRVWALESSSRSRSLFELASCRQLDPIMLVVGNEVSGVDPAVLEICDEIAWIPMRGFKESLNVAIAFGIAAYTLRYASQNSS
jgi:23S rRNA (guanosine2251-2'-O)-methyltransferase